MSTFSDSHQIRTGGVFLHPLPVSAIFFPILSNFIFFAEKVQMFLMIFFSYSDSNQIRMGRMLEEH